MKRFNKKKNLISFIIVLFLCIGLGYAFLNATLNINGTAKINNNTWDIHFVNLQVNSNSVSLSTGDSAAVINPSNNTEVTYTITLQKPGDFYEFTVDAKNFGTIDGMIESVNSKLNGVEISTTNPLPNYLDYKVTYSDDIPIDENHLLTAGSQVTYKVRLEYKKDIEISDLPSSVENQTLSFGVTSIQSDETAIIKPEWPVIGDSTMTGNTYRSATYREKIKTINLDDEINPPESPIISWDIGVAQNGNVMAYLTTNADDNTMYDLTIQGDGHLYANPDSRYLFNYLKNVDLINNMDVLDTSKVTDMASMFLYTGYNSNIFTLDLGNKFDTSNVTNMTSMFSQTGYNSQVFTIDLGNKFDTSNVTNMTNMFDSTGYKSTVFTLDLGSKFDTSKVTNMQSMFRYTGYSSPVFTLNLGNKFDTSNVTNMGSMFLNTGYSSLVFTLNLGDKFDTSNVTIMSTANGHDGAGSMGGMFEDVGYSSPVFTLDLGNKFDTSKVANMSRLFAFAGRSSSVFTLDLGDKFDTSNVTNMGDMFFQTGFSNQNFTLDLGDKFNTTNVTIWGGIFGNFKTTSKIYVKDATTQSWIINNSGNAFLTTANVLIKS